MSLFSSSNRRISKSAARRGVNPLEISARPDRERSKNLQRRLKMFLKVVSLSGLAVGAVFGGRWGMKRFVWENPTYALSDLRTTTDGLLTRKQILEIAGLYEGENIFRLDLLKAKQALDQLPQVERVEVRRILPDRVDIRISERQPVAWVAPSATTRVGVDTEAYLVDVRGYVMRPRKVMPEHLALPLITGVVMEDVAPGQKLPTAEALSAVELIRLTAEDLRWQPRVVDISKGYCLTVTDNRKARITFGFDAIEDQLAKLHRLIELVEPTQKEFVSVNLMLERSVPVVFATPAPVQPATDSKNGKSKGNSGKSTSPVSPVKAVDDMRTDLSGTDPSQKPSALLGAVATSAGAVRAAVSGGVVESPSEQSAKAAPLAPAKVTAAASVAASPSGVARDKTPAKVETPTDRRGVTREEVNSGDSQSRTRVKAASSAPLAHSASSSGGKGSAEMQKTEVPKATYPYKKTYGSKTARSSSAQPRQNTGTQGSASERALTQSNASSSSGSRSKSAAGASSKENSPAARRPSLNPTEALRKLFSPHG